MPEALQLVVTSESREDVQKVIALQLDADFLSRAPLTWSRIFPSRQIISFCALVNLSSKLSMDATPLRACSPDSLPPLEPSCSDLSDDDEPKHRQPQVEPQPRQEKTLEEYVNEWRSLKEMEEESSRHHAKQAQLAMVARYLDMKIEESKARP